MKEFTPEQLSAFNGKDGQPLYIAVRGQVFDVSEGSSFYGPGGPYECFAGRECSRALGIMKVEEAECNDNLSDLTDKQLQILQDWIKKFTQKYPVVGKVKQDPSAKRTTQRKSSIARTSKLVINATTVIAVLVAVVAAVMFLTPHSSRQQAAA